MRATNRGIVIVSILVLTLLATFFLGALVQMNPGRLRRNVHDENRDRATMAARAGVDYVLSRFKSDTNWVGDANNRTVDMKDLVIREDNGNVLGWIRTEDGSWSGFRVRFNAQDGEGGFDSRGNPMYPINNSAISLNNLGSLIEKAVPKATSSSVAKGSIEPGDPNTVMIMPGNSVAMQVEGIVAPDLKPDDPSGLAEIEDATIRTVEGIYVISDIISGRDDSSVVSGGGPVTANINGSGGTISTDLGNREVEDGVLSLQSDSDNAATIRTKGYFDLKGDNFDPDQDASVRTNPGKPFTKELADGTTFEGGIEEKDAAYQKVEAERVLPPDSGGVKIPAGVYIFTKGDADGGRSPSDNVKFFDMTWDDYRDGLMDDDPSTPVEGTVDPKFLDMVELDAVDVTLTRNGTGEVSNEKRDLIRVTGDVEILDSEGKGFTVVPERGARQKAGTDSGPGDVDPPSWDTGEAQGHTATVMNGLSSVWELTPGGEFNVSLQDGSSIKAVDFGGSIVYQPANAAQIFWQEAAAGNPMTILGASGNTYPTIGGADFHQINGAQSYLRVDDIQAFAAHFNIQGPPGQASDPLHIPEVHPDTGETIGLEPGVVDKTVPQDIEIVFDPAEDNDSAFIRSKGDIFLGTHLSGEGGGVVSGGQVDLVGFGINIRAKTDQNMDERQDRTGVAIYGTDGVNISTYDERRNSYWDVEVKGAVFTEGNLFLRMGEDPLTTGQDPPWGLLDFEGSMIALGDAPSIETDSDNRFWGGEGEPDNTPYEFNENHGRVDMFARGVRLFYDPRYLAPLLEEGTINPTFSALSVVER